MNTCKCGRHVPCRHCKQDWECFSDMSYYDLWCVRRINQRGWGQGFHVASQQEAVALTEMLNAMSELIRQRDVAISIGLDAVGQLIDIHHTTPKRERNVEWECRADLLDRNFRKLEDLPDSFGYPEQTQP